MARYRRAAVVLAALAVAVPVLYLRSAPLDPPEDRVAVPGTVVLDSHGVVLARDVAEGTRIPVALEDVAPTVLWATVSAEDRRFWHHPGIDAVAVARALIKAGSEPSGASTITQQLARRLYLGADADPLLLRKAREAILALQLEAHRSKAEILALYLNDVYYGRGAYGIEAAARAYFGTSARDLDLAHAAYLAGLPQRPSAYDPESGCASRQRLVRCPETDERPARARQAYVLGRMVEDGWISREKADEARRRPIRLLPAVAPRLAPHFVAHALAEVARERPDLAGRHGLIVETTLDAGLQAEADRLARLHLARLGDRNVTNAAVLAIEPGSGRILALVGGATDGDARHGGEIDMTTALRQPGSALKPFLYAAAFERASYTPATPLLDVPTTFRTERGPYSPLNADRTFHGIVPLRAALGSSLNVPAVRTLETIGVEAMLEISHRFGLATLSAPEAYGLALTLGGGEVRLLDLTSAYAALAAGGELAAPYAVTRVHDSRGHVLYDHTPGTPRRVLSAQHAYLLADILSDPDARILGFGETSPFELPFPAAAKSGTTTGFRDDWTVGFTPEIAVGVWVGNAEGSPMDGVPGVEGAAPIWRDVMSAAAFGRRMTWPSRPAGIVEATVCAPTGLLPGRDCPSPMRELFIEGTQPTARERFYQRQADGRIAIDPPVESRAWAEQAGYRLVRR
jgi:penicillin-binding protein 1C